jgi:hypothetical protein
MPTVRARRHVSEQDGHATTRRRYPGTSFAGFGRGHVLCVQAGYMGHETPPGCAWGMGAFARSKLCSNAVAGLAVVWGRLQLGGYRRKRRPESSLRAARATAPATWEGSDNGAMLAVLQKAQARPD